jgi:hypothetical protein
VTNIDEINLAIQRGFARAVVTHGHVGIQSTDYAVIVARALVDKVGVPCMTCGTPHPKVGHVPWYSECDECRKNQPKYFMEAI